MEFINNKSTETLYFEQIFLSLQLNSFLMSKEQLNRLKIILAEKNRTNKWLAEQLGKEQATVSKWVNQYKPARFKNTNCNS